MAIDIVGCCRNPLFDPGIVGYAVLRILGGSRNYRCLREGLYLFHIPMHTYTAFLRLLDYPAKKTSSHHPGIS